MSDATLRDLVESFINKIRAQNSQPISAPFVGDAITASMPHAAVFSLAEKTAVYIGACTVAREILRGRHKHAYDAERIGQGELDLPEAALLNDGYSVMRADEPVYVPRLQMTRADMEYVCSNFDGLSEYFARASRALRADYERRNLIAA